MRRIQVEMFKCGLLGVLFVAIAAQSQAQFRTKLKHETEAEFEVYAKEVEAELNDRWSGKRAFLQISEDPASLETVMKGDLFIQADVSPNPHAISAGLIHDWYGAVFIPNATLSRVLSVLQDFDHHASIYPQISKSKLIKREGDVFTSYWRMEQKGQMLPAVFDVTLKTQYRQVSADKWVSSSHGNDVQAVEDEGSKKEKALPPGEGNGLMWKLYSYWTLERVGGGVIAECRSVSLSRGVPGTIAWMIRPLLNTIPRESMDSTLRNTRKASGE